MRERRDAKKKQEQEAVENKLRRVQLRNSSHVFKSKAILSNPLLFNLFNHPLTLPQLFSFSWLWCEESKEEIKRLLSEEKLESEWSSYMRCNGLPNANDPSDLRKYIHMWVDDAKKSSKKEINWLLKTNEQSILTQDQTVIDLSRTNLKKLQPETGEVYAKRGSEVLGILHEMDVVIRDRYSLSPNKMDDLLDVSDIQFGKF